MNWKLEMPEGRMLKLVTSMRIEKHICTLAGKSTEKSGIRTMIYKALIMPQRN